MKKRRIIIPIILGFFAFSVFMISAAKPGNGENITVTTYYPSPNGVYRTLNVSELILKPLDQPPEDPVEGMIFFSSGKGKDDKGNRIEKGIWVCANERWYPLMFLEERTKK